jgi:hypothetical protein
MRLKYFLLALTVLALASRSSATSYIVPTTTLAAQTSNNTSAANAFGKQSNGNRGAGNISKLDVHSLLYSGATTKVYAHLLLWFGQSNHMNIGYSSTDPAQVKRQIEDMISRGIDGVIIDWYGPNNAIDQATQLVMAEAENHPGFTFAIMIDQGAIEWNSCQGCSPQEALIDQLQYIEKKYFPSPAYMTEQGQPVVTNFNIDLSYSVDWNAANAALSTHPYFLFQNNDGFSHVLSGGSYSWVMPTTNDYGAGYLSNFYNTGMSFPSEQTVGATYKGFNDTLASWGSNRIMGQQCGQTWLQMFAKVNTLYNSGKQLSDLQLVTWNDYEEGTEIESGIDNCFVLSASVSGNALQWTVGGNEDTVEKYTVYVSSDGQNVMALTDAAVGTHALNLCSFPIPSGNYKLFVQAVGKPSLANQITGSIAYTPSCHAGGSPPPTLSLTASPTSVLIPPGYPGKLIVTAKPQSGSFNNPVSLSCGGLPRGWNCSFSPATLTPGSKTATSALTISSGSSSSANLSSRRRMGPIYAGWLLSLGIAGFTLIGASGRRNQRVLALCTIVGLGVITSSCGGIGAGDHPPSTAYTVTINGNSGSSHFSTTVIVNIQ